MAKSKYKQYKQINININILNGNIIKQNYNEKKKNKIK